MTAAERARSFRIRQLLAFLAVYLVWGSTYLAIRFAIATLPGLSMAGARFLLAGGLLYAWSSWRGEDKPSLAHWRGALIVGGMLFLGGNGAVVWAEQRLASGLAALLVGTEPLWVALILWLSRAGRRPSLTTIAGLLLGFAGAAVLALSSKGTDGGAVHLPSVLVVLIGCASWAAGSLYARNVDAPASPLRLAAMQMLSGGALLSLAGGAIGEWQSVDVTSFSAASLVAFGYLVIFGSIVAFTSYSFLMRTTEPTLVSTYAYVNPVVAVLLGWWLGAEPLGWPTALATALIIGSVLLVSRSSPAAASAGGPDSVRQVLAVEPPLPFGRCDAAVCVLVRQAEESAPGDSEAARFGVS